MASCVEISLGVLKKNRKKKQMPKTTSALEFMFDFYYLLKVTEVEVIIL